MKAWLIGFTFGCLLAAVAWLYSGQVTQQRIAHDATNAMIAAETRAKTLADSASTLALQTERSTSAARIAEARFVADSSLHLAAVRALLARLNDTTARLPPVVPVPEVRAALQGCLLTIGSCGASRTADSVRIADLERELANAKRQITNGEDALRTCSLRHSSVAAQRESGRTWRDVKVGGLTFLATGAACAVSHFGPRG
jgi:hypothetical protein